MSSVSAVRYLPPRFIDVATGAKWVGSTCESSAVSAVCVFCLRHTRRFGLVSRVLPDVFFSRALFAGVIHICLSGAYPRFPRLGEVAELSPLNSAWDITGCKCNRQSGPLPD